MKKHQKQKYDLLAFRTVVMEKPLLTSVSAIQPPIFAKTAMVSHGRTHNSPDSVRLNFRTWENNTKFIHQIYLFLSIWLHHWTVQVRSRQWPQSCVDLSNLIISAIVVR